MPFKEMDPEMVWSLLEGHQDILKPMVQEEEKVLQSARCPSCQAYNLERILDRAAPFRPNSPLPNILMRCLSCKAEFLPRTGIIVKPASSG